MDTNQACYECTVNLPQAPGWPQRLGHLIAPSYPTASPSAVAAVHTPGPCDVRSVLRALLGTHLNEPYSIPTCDTTLLGLFTASGVDLQRLGVGGDPYPVESQALLSDELLLALQRLLAAEQVLVDNISQAERTQQVLHFSKQLSRALHTKPPFHRGPYAQDQRHGPTHAPPCPRHVPHALRPGNGSTPSSHGNTPPPGGHSTPGSRTILPGAQSTPGTGVFIPAPSSSAPATTTPAIRTPPRPSVYRAHANTPPGLSGSLSRGSSVPVTRPANALRTRTRRQSPPLPSTPGAGDAMHLRAAPIAFHDAAINVRIGRARAQQHESSVQTPYSTCPNFSSGTGPAAPAADPGAVGGSNEVATAAAAVEASAFAALRMERSSSGSSNSGLPYNSPPSPDTPLQLAGPRRPPHQQQQHLQLGTLQPQQQ